MSLFGTYVQYTLYLLLSGLFSVLEIYGAIRKFSIEYFMVSATKNEVRHFKMVYNEISISSTSISGTTVSQTRLSGTVKIARCFCT